MACQKGVKSERKQFAPRGANSFLLELTPNEMGGKKSKNRRVASPESIPIHLKLQLLLLEQQDLSQGQDSLPDSALPIT